MSVTTASTLTLNGHLIQSWQRARRRFAIESQYRLNKWYPPTLFSATMRQAVFRLSNGADLTDVTNKAVTNFMSVAKFPGLDVPDGTNTYTLAMDFCATIRTVLECLSRMPLMSLSEKPPIKVPGLDLKWSFLSYPDDSGVLHRWEFVDYINADTIAKAMHSWAVIGDVILAGAPLELHLVSIGKTENSMRISPWCRAYASPVVHNVIRFRKRSGKVLEGDWKLVRFADLPKPDAADWVTRMLSDNVPSALIYNATINEPEPVHVRNFYRDLEYEYGQIVESNVYAANFDPMTLPMCRSACDSPYVCPHQFVCYSTNTTLANSGLYTRIGARKPEGVTPMTQEVDRALDRAAAAVTH